MRKLLSADFSRLWRDKLFWICMGTMLIYSVVYMLNGSRQAAGDMAEYNYGIEKYYFHFALSIGMFCALFSSMFFGTEYSDGTIRNKIVVGHTRMDIYFASLITTIAATLLMMLVWLTGALVAVPALGVWKMTALELFSYLWIAVLFVMAFSGICTFVCMTVTNKAYTVMISMLLILGLLIFTSMLYNGLGQPETISDVQITSNGMELSEPFPNPNYVSGAMRKVYDFILDFLPTGQGLRMWQLEIIHPIRMIVSSVIIITLTSFCGIFLFQKKNLR